MAINNYFNATPVNIDFNAVKQVDSKPAASGFADGNIIFDKTEQQFYQALSGSWIALDFIGDDFTVNKLAFNTAATETLSTGELAWNADDETVDMHVGDDVTIQLGQEMVYHVVNQTGSQIDNGTVVMADGALGASGKIKVVPAIADGSVPAKYIMGVATEDIPNGALGYVTAFGKVRGFNTSSYSSGTVLYASATSSGSFTDTIPAAPNAKVTVAITLDQKNNGTIFVRPTYGPTFAESQDVTITSASNNDVLRFDFSTSVWVNEAFSSLETYSSTSDLTNALNTEYVRTQNNANVKIGVGAIRNSGSGFQFINDASHEPLGFSSVSNDSNSITVFYGESYSEVGSFVVTPDETLALYGITTGASVGLSSSEIKMYAPLSVLIDTLGSGSITVPAIFDGDVTYSASLNEITITHKQCNSNVPPQVSIVPNTDTTRQSAPIVGVTYGATIVKIHALTPLAANISYNGSTWDVVRDTKNPITASWDASNSRLDISHESMNSSNDLVVSAVSRTSTYRTIVDSVSEDNTYIKFVDASGSVASTPDTNMDILFSRSGFVEAATVGDQRFVVHRENILLNPNTVDVTSSNLWLMMMHKV